jgi:hypothetical protein
MKANPKTAKCQRCGRRHAATDLKKIGQGAMQRRLCTACRTDPLPFATGIKQALRAGCFPPF